MWLKLDVSARDNRKIRRFAAALGISYPQALGHLALLWLWRIEDGDLTGFTDQEVAAAARWSGNAAQLVEVLRLSGLAEEQHGRCLLHDHDEYQGSLKEARRKARQRARKRGAQLVSRDGRQSSRDNGRSRDMSRDTLQNMAGLPGIDPLLSEEIDRRMDALVAAPTTRY